MEQKENHRLLILGMLITLIAYLFFSVGSSCVRALHSEIPTVQILFFQNLISFFIILPYFFRAGYRNITTKMYWMHLIRDAVGVASYYLYYLAIFKIGLVDATTFYYTAPFYVPIIWKIWMKGTIEKEVWWSIIIGFIGLIFILKPGPEILQFGSVVGLVAGVLSSIALIVLRILNRRGERVSKTLLYYYFFGIIVTCPFIFIDWVTPTISEWFFLLSIGIAVGIGQTLLTIAFRYGTASFLSPLSYTMIIYTWIAGWIFFGEGKGWTSYIGAFLIVFGGTVTYLLRRKPQTLVKLFALPVMKKKKK